MLESEGNTLLFPRSDYSLAMYCHIPNMGTFTDTAVKTSKFAKKYCLLVR